MASLKEEFETWLNTYGGNLLEFEVDETGLEYSIDIDALRTDIEDGMYEVELSVDSQSRKAENKLCIVDGMVVLETLVPVIEEHLELDPNHTGYEGVSLRDGMLMLRMAS